MRVLTRRRTAEDLRRRLLRLDGLPLRPVTARTFLGALPEAPADDDPEDLSTSKPHPGCELDPGWVLAVAGNRRTSDGSVD